MKGCAAECLLCYISLVMLGWAVSLPDTFRSTMSQSVNLDSHCITLRLKINLLVMPIPNTTASNSYHHHLG